MENRDPLQAGYRHVEGLIVKGLQPDAPQQDKAVAQELAPTHQGLRNENFRQLFRGGVFPVTLILVILVGFCIVMSLVTYFMAPIILPNDNSIAANDGEVPAPANEQAEAPPTAPALDSTPEEAGTSPGPGSTEQQPGSSGAEAGQATVVAPPTSTPTSLPSPTPAATATEQPTETAPPSPTAVPPTEQPPTPIRSPEPTLAPVDLFALAQWSPDELIWSQTGPIIYQNAEGMWSLRSDVPEGHVFWVQQDFQHFPFGIQANVFLGKSNGRYGLVLESTDMQQGLALYTYVDPLTEQGMYTIELKDQNEAYSEGPLVEYNTGFGKNILEVQVRADLVEFIVNGQTVDTLQSAEILEAGWRIGISLEVDGTKGTGGGSDNGLAHLVIDPTDSIKVYQLPPAAQQQE